MSGYDYSVAILGSGIAGSTLANILARHGHSVVLVDSGSHPRFALGESTIGETSYLLKLLWRGSTCPNSATSPASRVSASM